MKQACSQQISYSSILHLFNYLPSLPLPPPHNNRITVKGSVNDAYPLNGKIPIQVMYTPLLWYKLLVTAFISQSA
jgi:hypothetical protein